MALNKTKRTQVYAKFDGHCAYCGAKIQYEDMQVDHIISKFQGGSDDLSNLHPSCRMCNFRKGTLSIKQFRKEIKNQAEIACGTFQARMSIAYGLIKKTNKEVKFYFETRKPN